MHRHFLLRGPSCGTAAVAVVATGNDAKKQSDVNITSGHSHTKKKNIEQF